MSNIILNWFEVFLVVIGAVLGFLLSIVTTIINKEIDKHGEIKLYYKLTNQKIDGSKAGIYTDSCDTYISIPLYFELQNTTNSSRVIRDASLYLYKDGKQVSKMLQIQYTEIKKEKDGQKSFEYINFGADKNSYSFMLPPMSIQKQECNYLYKIPTCDTDKYSFDQIRFSYYDEKDRVMECVFCNAEHGWQEINFNYENEYIQLKCHRKK